MVDLYDFALFIPTRRFLVFSLSLLFLISAYHLLARRFCTPTPPPPSPLHDADEDKRRLKHRAWILTSLSSLVMSIVSLPFCWEFLASGGDMYAVQEHKQFAESATVFFVAYLLCDMGIGFKDYCKLVNCSSGWVHHSLYTILCTHLVRAGYARFFCLAAVLELPTFIMSVSVLAPKYRSNNAFTWSFFATRIVFHALLVSSFCTPHGRAHPAVQGSFEPLIYYALPFPMHCFWFVKCIKSMRRRMRKRKAEAAAAAAALAEQQAAKAEPAVTPDMSDKADTVLAKPAAITLAADLNGRSPARGSSPSFRRPRFARPDLRVLPQLVRQRRLPAYEARQRARRALLDALRRAWASAPLGLREAVERELGVRLVDSTVDGQLPHGEEGPRSSPAPTATSLTRQGLRRRLSALPSPTELFPEFFAPADSDEWAVRPFPVERAAQGGRRTRVVGALRRKVEIARREVVVWA